MEQRLSVCSAPARKRSTREAPHLEEFMRNSAEPSVRLTNRPPRMHAVVGGQGLTVDPHFRTVV